MLSDDRRRWEYDRFEYPLLTGTMPDGSDPQTSMSPGGHTFVWESSFDSARRAQGRHGTDGFARGSFDPFELFNSMFARDFHEMEANSGFDDSFMNWGMSFPGVSNIGRPTSFGAPQPFASRNPLVGESMSPPSFPTMASFGSLFGQQPIHASMPGGNTVYSSSSSNYSFQGGSGNASESRRTTVVNGRRETIITKRDAQGNETVRKITPEGETIHINGQLQTALEPPPAPQAVEMARGEESSSKESKSDSSGHSSWRKKWKLF